MRNPFIIHFIFGDTSFMVVYVYTFVYVHYANAFVDILLNNRLYSNNNDKSLLVRNYNTEKSINYYKLLDKNFTIYLV